MNRTLIKTSIRLTFRNVSTARSKPIDVELYMTVYEVKRKIAEIIGIRAEEQLFMSRG